MPVHAQLRVMAAALLLTACAGTGSRSSERLYPVPSRFDATQLLPPPPSAEAALRRDLEAVRAAQRTRTPEQAAQAEANSAVDPFRFAAVLGPRFTAEQLPHTARFLQQAYRSALPYLQATKDCWNRPRPFVVDPTLAPLERSLASTRLRTAPAPAPKATPSPPAFSACTAPAADASYGPSYPSGHAVVGALLAIVLAEMVPEQRAALFAFGWDYGEARVISGVHFPSDVEAGRILGTMLVELMSQSARFRGDLKAARRELRKALGYP
jgi:acid phosphatase (class A)